MPPSELSKALSNRAFQKQGALFAMQHKRVLIADEPGLGKTIQSIAAVIGSKTNGSVLVVAPKTAMYVTWPAELARWLADVAPNDKLHIIGGKLTRKERIETLVDILEWEQNYRDGEHTGRQWVLVSPNYLRFTIQTDDHGHYVYDDNGDKVILPVREALTGLLAIRWAAVIVDEAHQTLAGATGNLKKQSAQSRGLRLLTIEDGGLRLALSGTPFRGKHENLWGILNWIRPDLYTSYWDWVKKHFDVYTDYMLGVDVVGQLKSEAALAREAQQLMIRRTKQKVAPDLPPKTYGGTPLPGVAKEDAPVAVWLPMDGEQAKAYADMKRNAMADLDGGTLMANSILAEMVRLKQFANSSGYLDPHGEFHPKLPSNKFDMIVELLAERGIDGKGPGESKVVIASQFTRHINLFAGALRAMGIGCYVLTGQTKEQERVDMQEEFQNGTGYDVFLLNTIAGGVSLTLDAADDLIMIDETYNVDDSTQVEDRIHRISRMHCVTIWKLKSLGTIEETLAREQLAQSASLRRILDGPQGTSVARRLIGG